MGLRAAPRTLRWLRRLLARALVLVGILAVLFALAGRWLVVSALRSALPQGWDVALDRLSLGPGGLYLGGIQLEAPELGSIDIDGLDIAGPEIARQRGAAAGLHVRELTLTGLRIALDPAALDGLAAPAPGRSFPGTARASPSLPFPIAIERVIAAGCRIELPGQGGRIEAAGSLGPLRLAAGGDLTLGSLAAQGSSLDPLVLEGSYGRVELSGLLLRIDSPALRSDAPEPLALAIEAGLARLRWNEHEFLALDASARSKPGRIDVAPLRGSWLGAGLHGRALVELDSPDGGVDWRVEGRLRSVALARVIEQFRLAESVRAWGQWDLQFDIAGHDRRLTLLSAEGRQRPGERGWVDVISADALLARLGAPAAAEIEHVVRSLRDYDVESGELQVSQQPAGFIVQLRLDGPAGSRSIELRLQTAAEEQTANTTAGLNGNDSTREDS